VNARYDARVSRRILIVFLLALASVGSPSRAAARPAVARPATAVAGVLRHKGCSTSPAGASVSVIGRDATTLSDGGGRFSLTLPPGTYSLLISGPGLVPDQRVDDVVLLPGQTHDLGAVEVWPEERPADCAPGAAAPVPSAVVATAPGTPALDLPGSGVAPAAVAPDQIWVRGAGGAAPGQFGLQGNPARDDEDALGPSSFAIGPQGSLWVLDSVNSRVQRFDARGRPASSFAVGRPGEEPPVEADLVVNDEGHVFLFTQSDSDALVEYDASGRPLLRAALPNSFKGVDLLFTSRRGRPVFLMQNGQAVRAELSWDGVRANGPLPGLPTGDLFVSADRVDRWRAEVKLSTADGRVRRSVQLHSSVPITGVRLVGVDRRGEIVLALDRAEAADGGTPRAEVLLLVLDQYGHLAGTARVPPGGRRFEFREFALAPDGTVVQMQSDVSEVRFVRWTLRAPPRQARSGEGLVRGRVVDTGRSGLGASVLIGRLRRVVPVAADGTFELRLPTGTWLLSVRRAAAAGVPEAPPVELKVAVAAGATVDLGTVSLARPPPRAPLGSPDGGVPAAAGIP
jgi:hypothetical protein